MLANLRRFDQSKVAQERLKIIKFYEKYGEEACKEAFGVDRKLIYVWRKKMEKQNNHLSALVSLSHIFSYPRYPQINSIIERYNRRVY